MKDNDILGQKAEDFAVRIVKLRHYLLENKKEHILSAQILRSGTSVGANLAEARFGISKNDFLAKIYVSVKECSETQYWLRLLKRTGYITDTEYDSLEKDCGEIAKLLTKSIKTTKCNIERDCTKGRKK